MPEVALQLVLLAVVVQKSVGAVVLGIEAVPHLPTKIKNDERRSGLHCSLALRPSDYTVR